MTNEQSDCLPGRFRHRPQFPRRLAVAILCGAACLTAFSQTKPETTSKSDGSGGKLTTTKWEEGDKQYTKEVHTDAHGKRLSERTDVVGPEGSTGEIIDYKDDGSEKPFYRHAWKSDNTGATTETQTEEYTDGILVKGKICVLRPGDTHFTTVKKWSNIHGRYEDVPLEQQEAEGKAWKEFETKLEKDTKEREEFFRLMRVGKISFESSGTGETIGHIGDVKLQNLTDHPIEVYLPATVLESRHGGQDYVVPEGQQVTLHEHETRVVPLDGTCLERDKPPASKDDHDLVFDDIDQPQVESHFAQDEVADLLETVQSIYKSADQLTEEGDFKDFPYADKQEQENICIQWATWGDPRISEITGSPPADKEDFKKAIDKQLPKHGKVSRDTRRKIDKGTDSMWDGIELTSEKAKDLEPAPSPGTVNVSDDDDLKKSLEERRTQIKEKKKDWKTREKLYYKALGTLALASAKYNNALKTYCRDHSKDYKDLVDKRDKAEKAAKAEGATKTDQDALKQAEAALAKLQSELEKDFVKTPEGKQLADDADKAGKELDKAKTDMDAAKDAYDKANAPIKPLRP